MVALAVARRADAGRCPTSRCTPTGRPTRSTTLDRLAAAGVDTADAVLHHRRRRVSGHRDWKDYPAILDRCHFVVVSRPGCRGRARSGSVLPASAARMIDARETPCRHSRPIFLVDAPTAPVSSTDVRRRAGRRARRSTAWCRRPSRRTSRGMGCIARPTRRSRMSQSRTPTPQAPTGPAPPARGDHARRSPPPSTRRRSTSSCSTCARRRRSPTSSSSARAPTSGRCRRSPTRSRRRCARKACKPGARRRLRSAASGCCIDYFDFIVHIFTPATREFYGLERLWGDAERD